MQQRRSLKASFVVTVAAAVGALDSGCSDSGPNYIVNPPFIECPSTPPTHGSACNPSVGTCSYSCSSGGQGTANCVNSVWQSQIGTCNPPAPDVPDPSDASDVMVLPDTNPPSDVPDVPVAPDAADATADASNDTASDAASDASMCPEAEPTDGAACPTPGVTCQYGMCGPTGGRQTHANCDSTGHWSNATLICNPPLVLDAGPDA